MNIHIPPAALEAGGEAFLECDRSPACSFEDALRAAFVAIVEAWPEAKRVKGYFTHDTDYYEPAFILPLAQKQEDGDE